MSILKKALSILFAVCLLASMCTVANAEAMSQDQEEQYNVIIAGTVETTDVAPYQKIIEPHECFDQADYNNYILYGEKNFYFTPTIINIDELLSNSTNVKKLRNGNQTGTFKSPKMDTGTPFVKWYYTVDYEIEPYSNGYGWRFKSVQGYVYIQKGLLLYTWANSCIVTVERATHSLNSARTTVTISIGLKFEVSTDAFAGIVTYYENHTHTTSISNLSPY